MTLDCSPNDPFADREGSLHASSSHSSSLACKCSPRRHSPTGARAACELFALLDPSAAPPKGIVNALVAAARSTREDREDEDEGGQGDQGGKGGKGGWTDGGNAMRTWRRPACKCSPRRDFPTGVWCAALLSLCCRPRPTESAAATSQSHQAFEALASIALHKSDTSSQQRYTSSQQALPLSLLSVAACLAVLPPTRAAELTDSLCEAEIDLCSRPACKCSPRRPHPSPQVRPSSDSLI